MLAEDWPPHPPYGSSGAVEVWSASLRQWLAGTVVKVEGSGNVFVRYGPGDREKLLLPGSIHQVLRPIFSAGDSIEVFSSSLRSWFVGKVQRVSPDGGVAVEYGGDRPELPEKRCKALLPQDAAKSLRLAYSANDQVEVWSATLKKWLPGTILTTSADGVKVTYGGGMPELPKPRVKALTPSDMASSLRPLLCLRDSTRGAAHRYRKGDAVEVWSESRSKWVGGVVEEAPDDGALKVSYGLRSTRLSRAEVAALVRRAGGQLEISESACLSELTAQFRALDADGSGSITADELARRWAAAARAHASRPLTDAERKLIATGVQTRLEALDVDRDGRVSMVEWLHQALLDKHHPGTAACEALAARVRERGGVAALGSIVNSWAAADTDGNGLLSRAELRKLPRKRGEAAKVFERIDAHGSGSVTYAEWCAHELGLTFNEVELYYYDISDGAAKFLAPVLIWRRFEGVWHTGVVVFGSEYYFGGDVFCDPPGETCFGTPTKTIKLGLTLRSQDELDELCEEGGALDLEFCEDNYDFLEHNCNHFSDAAVQFLLGRHIPEEVRKQPAAAMSSPVVQAVRPFMNNWLGNLDGTRTRTGGGGAPAVTRSHPGGNASSFVSAACENKVLYETPGSLHPVVAHVLRVHNNGGLDLCWFDAAGNRQTATKVDKNDTRPLQATNENTNFRAVYLAALLALDDAEAHGPVCDDATLQAAFGRRQTAAPSAELACLEGHPMTRLVGQIAQEGRGAVCDQCGRDELGASTPYYLHCNACGYDLCPACAERQHTAAAARADSAGASG